MLRRHAWLGVVLAMLASSLSGAALAADAASPGELVQEHPTLQCLGVRWFIGGDENQNARVGAHYRKVGAATWTQGLDLFRVETRAIRGPDRPPPGHTMHAGSVFGLEEDAEYEVRLSLADPDGGNAERTLRMRTWAEPRLPRGGRTIDVRPGGLRRAIDEAQPGDVLRLRAGVYPGTWQLKSGVPGRPIAMIGAGDGEAILDGQGKARAVDAPGLHDFFFENLTVQNAEYGLVIHGASRVTIRRSTIREVEYGIVATRNQPVQHEIFIADNTLVGRSTWPRTHGIENRRGVQVSGTGHVVCYNRIRGFADGIDTFQTYPCAAIDFYRNDISECTDDGIEMDYSQYNTRCFENRLTNVFQGISVQPVHGGPVYIFRNALYNVSLETFKLHNSPSGAIFYHNTSVKAGMPLMLYTRAEASNCTSRNNLFVGASGIWAYENTAPMRDCDFDYDGFAGAWRQFLRWNGRSYATLEDAAQSAPVYRHAVRVSPEGLFQSGAKAPADTKEQQAIDRNDLRLADGSRAIDAGAPLPGVNQGHRGRVPDLGAYEFGEEPPHYGPRAAAKRE